MHLSNSVRRSKRIDTIARHRILSAQKLHRRARSVKTNSRFHVARRIALVLLVLAVGTAPASTDLDTITPIKHLVVIFQENHSFDAYFATYPVAVNPPGQPAFHARPETPSVNGLTPALLERNPNSSNPFRIDRLQSFTCDQDHDYTAEQRARNGGLMDQFPRFDAQPPTDPRQFCHKGSDGQWDTLMGISTATPSPRSGTMLSTSPSPTTASPPCLASRRVA